jgi:hypothetical protein
MAVEGCVDGRRGWWLSSELMDSEVHKYLILDVVISIDCFAEDIPPFA